MIRNVKSKMDRIVYQQSFSVRFEYPVLFTREVFHPDNPVFLEAVASREKHKRHRFVVFIDDGVVRDLPSSVEEVVTYANTHPESLELVTDPITVSGGERIKVDLKQVESMQRVLFDHHIDRHSFVIGIGGGAVLDAVGWVAATAHRGVRHIRIPTTVLAQNDSGVGVKNGVNFFGVKNYMGSFAPPWAVINDLRYVLNLPHRDKVAGIAEAVKVALIRDADFFQWLCDHVDDLANCEPEAMEWMIRRCAELHMHQIANGGDPFETGSARPLDFGHWSAHKIESMSNYAIRHGEAVAIGMAIDARYSTLSGLLPAGGDQRVCELLENLGFELWHPMLEEVALDGTLQVLQGLEDFKEHLGGELTVTLLDDIGVGIELHSIDTELMLQSIQWLKDRACR